MILKFMLPLAALGLAFGLRADPVQTITFKVLTTFGDPVEAKLVSLVAMHGKEISTNCQGLRCTNISEGAYSYSFVLASNQRKIDGNAVIYRTNQVVIVDVGTGPADLGDDDYPVVRGKVLHAGADASKLWVRLQPLYSDTGVSAAVNADGSFQVDEVRPGKWMLLVFRENELIHHQLYQCKLTDPNPVSIDLEAAKP